MANEDKSTRYHRLRRRTSSLDTTAQAILLLALVLSGASSAIRSSIASSVGTGLVSLVVMYVVVIAALTELVHLPFAFYYGVVLERRYGLSTETPGRWLKDHFKAAVIALIVLVVAGVLVAWLLRTAPELWWLLSSIVFVTGLIVLARLAPVFLLPLFYDIRPLARETLRERLLALAEKSGTPVLGAYEWRVGDRTTRANAVLVGIGRTRRILVSDTLLAVHSDDEIETVFAHELAHHVYGDIWSALAFEAALLTLGCYAADYVLSSFAFTIGLDGKADVAGLPLVALTGGLVSLLFAPVANALSRAHERRADRYALDTTRNSTAFISAMKRLAATNLAEDRPSRLVELLFHTHPSTAARIEAAKAWSPD
ncbi:MAG TPA: M48 family metalloprotease [Vicinamibacterales bacterium]|nr:M48 family metalloprotease [Vicinamibacterales bacterium]